MIFSEAPNDFLMHYGIKGQKWGIRRYQNPDGTLTAEGRKRYGFNDIRKPDNIDKMSKFKRSRLALKEYNKILNKIGNESEKLYSENYDGDDDSEYSMETYEEIKQLRYDANEMAEKEISKLYNVDLEDIVFKEVAIKLGTAATAISLAAIGAVALDNYNKKRENNQIDKEIKDNDTKINFIKKVVNKD